MATIRFAFVSKFRADHESYAPQVEIFWIGRLTLESTCCSLNLGLRVEFREIKATVRSLLF